MNNITKAVFKDVFLKITLETLAQRILDDLYHRTSTVRYAGDDQMDSMKKVILDALERELKE